MKAINSSLSPDRMAARPIEVSEILKDTAERLGREKCRGRRSTAARSAKILNTIVSVAPRAHAALVFLTRMLVRLRFEDIALDLARLGAGRDDDRAYIHWELAKLILRRQRASVLQSDAAASDEGELLSALDVASRSTDCRIRGAAEMVFAEALFRSGHYRRALAAAEEGLSRSPKQVRLLRIMADSFIALRQFEKGQAVYDEMLALDPAGIRLTRTRQLIAPLSERREAVLQPHDAPASVLIGVGGGIGDMLHVTPVIRNIARRTGERVEIISLGDHPGSEFLVNNSEYAARVWSLSQEFLDRHYKTVLLTHSFGPMRLPFRADRICASHEWRTFQAGVIHETIFNLEVAKRLLGIEYNEGDATEHFVGGLKYRPPSSILVGVHAGSKSGRWLSKRWPYFRELGVDLAERGVRVASFGTADEYVDGTENRTGGTVEDMSRSMLDCTHFVSNDSGPMHIASALGIPVLGIFAPTDPMTHLPLRRTTSALALQKRCAPCEVKNHGYFAAGRCRCVADITVREVSERLLAVIERSPVAVRTIGSIPRIDTRSQGRIAP